ncbi:MAG: hypothetical protein ACYDCK_02600 [Thermoplasmatota archaeon]
MNNSFLIVVCVAIVVAVPASTTAADEPVKVQISPVVLTASDVGKVVVTGFLDQRLCVLPPYAMMVQLAPGQHLVHTSLSLTPRCQLILSQFCSVEVACSTHAALLDGSTRLEGRSNPGVACAGTKGVKADTWTLGYGGASDVLSETFINFYFRYGCGGVAQVSSYNGQCKFAQWNGWSNPSCYWATDGDATSSGVEQGIGGSFNCYNPWPDFCWQNHFYHTLYADVTGKDDGSAFCAYGTATWTGDLPPDHTTSHLHNTCTWL